MTKPPLEHDLLDLIEGRLAPDRVEAVRSALSSDPVLLRRVEQMVADRRGLVELQRATIQAARADRGNASELVAEAIEQAEREALVGSGAPRTLRRHSPLAAAFGMVAAAGLLAGGLTWFLLEKNQADRLAEQHKLERSGGARMDNLADPASPKAPGEGTDIANSDAEGSAARADSSTLPAAVPTWLNINPDPHGKEAVSAWTAEVEKSFSALQKQSTSLAEAGAQALKRFKAGGDARLSLDEAAGLAMTQRLRFVVNPTGLDWSRRRAEVVSAAVRASGTSEMNADAAEDSLTRGDLKIEVTAPLDPDGAALRDALGDLQRRFGGPGGERGWFELDSSTDGGAAALPSLRLSDILWWSNGPSAWQPGISVRVRVQALKN